MMRAGTDFTYNRKRYGVGDPFDLSSVPPHLHGTLTRLYRLTPARRVKPRPTYEENT